MQRRTFIFADVLEGKCQVGVFALDDAHLSEGASADDTQEAEMIEVYCSSVSQRDSIRRLAIIIHRAVSAFSLLLGLAILSSIGGGGEGGKDAAPCTAHVGDRMVGVELERRGEARGRTADWDGDGDGDVDSRTFAIEVDGLSLAVAHRGCLDAEDDVELS